MASATTVTNYLATQKKTSDKELAAEWTKIEDLYTEKLWNELTIKLIVFVKHASLNSEEAQLELYKDFISSFETKINPYGLVEMVEPLIHLVADKEEAVSFLEKLQTKVQACDEAKWYILVLQGEICLNHLNDLERAKKIVKEVQQSLDEAGNVTPIHGRFYKLAAQYHRRMGEHSDYYRCSLQFLGCSMDEYPQEEWPQEAFFLGLAALLGERTYNIGELLAHPIVESLQGTENEWVVDLLKAFNSGDVSKFIEMKPIWSQIPDLLASELKLRQKISLLCLMEITFKRPPNRRSISFEEIAKETQLPLKEVELLIMKALAQDLVRGQIDQVAGVVNMTWVQPRYLNRLQVKTMASTLDLWMQSITSMEQLMENKAGEILTN